MCAQRVARAATQHGAVVQDCSLTTRRRRGASYNYLLEELCCPALRRRWLTANLSAVAPRGGAATDGLLPRRQTTESRGTAPAVLARGAAGPRSRVGNERGASPAFGHRGATHPSRRRLRAREPSRMELCASSQIMPKAAGELHIASHYGQSCNYQTKSLHRQPHDSILRRCCARELRSYSNCAVINDPQAALAVGPRGAGGGIGGPAVVSRKTRTTAARLPRPDRQRRVQTTSRVHRRVRRIPAGQK